MADRLALLREIYAAGGRKSWDTSPAEIKDQAPGSIIARLAASVEAGEVFMSVPSGGTTVEAVLLPPGYAALGEPYDESGDPTRPASE